MFLIDDVLGAPFAGLLWVFRKVHEAAQEELAGQAEAITGQLRDLYLMLEAGQISESEFDLQEGVLLDRLDAASGRAEGEEDDEGEDPVAENAGENDSEEDLE